MSQTPASTPIPVVMITDRNYVLATRITIRSMLQFKHPDTEYRIHVLGIGLEPGDAAALRSEGGTIEIMAVPDRYRDFCKANTHVSTAALYKFDMPNLFPQYDKIIYTDVDVLILDDLTELFQRDVSNVYAALVKDYRGMAMLKLHEKLGLRNYYFSGMMLANLERWRREGLYEKFIELKKNNTFNGFMDQDVFNVAFHDEVLTLPVRYTSPTMKYWGPEGMLEAFYQGDEYRQINDFRHGKIIPGDTVFVHYFMKSKPWISLRNDKLMRYWWRFLTPREAIRLYARIIVMKVRKLFRH